MKINNRKIVPLYLYDRKNGSQQQHQRFGCKGMNRNTLLYMSCSLNILCFVVAMFVIVGRLHPTTTNNLTNNNNITTSIRTEKNAHTVTFHGGNPESHDITGTCWCSQQDQYCMCNPSLAIDVVLVTRSFTTTPTDADRVLDAVVDDDNYHDIHNYYIWLVRRKDTDQLATVGGFVKVGESVEDAVLRELKEETGIDLAKNDGLLKLFGIYSDPRRDNRRHTTAIAYAIHLDGTEQPPVAADDVKEVIKIPIQDIEKHSYYSDHMTILLDYRKILLQQIYQQQLAKNNRTINRHTNVDRQNESTTSVLLQSTDFMQSDHDFANDIIRSVCIPI